MSESNMFIKILRIPRKNPNNLSKYRLYGKKKKKENSEESGFSVSNIFTTAADAFRIFLDG